MDQPRTSCKVDEHSRCNALHIFEFGKFVLRTRDFQQAG